LNSDGSLDTGFNPGTGADGDVKAMALQADGKVFIGGSFRKVNGVARYQFARLNSDGSLDISFNPAVLDTTVLSIALQADGKLLLGGWFTMPRNHVVRLNDDGSLDTSFNPLTNANDTIGSVVLQADGKMFIGGSFTTVGGWASQGLARLNSNGSLDATFLPANTVACGIVCALVVQSDGKLLIGAGTSPPSRLNSDGSLDTSFNTGTGANGGVYSMALQADGKLWIGGNFTAVNGVTRNHIARLHTGDADVDGIEDGADAFLNNSAAAADYDHDGLPDAWLQPNAFGCVAGAPSCSGLILDMDDDNDGIPDYIDANPLDSAIHNEITLPVNSTYKGGQVSEVQSRM
jgi:uncharacterized delta-60 repeat protein